MGSESLCRSSCTNSDSGQKSLGQEILPATSTPSTSQTWRLVNRRTTSRISQRRYSVVTEELLVTTSWCALDYVALGVILGLYQPAGWPDGNCHFSRSGKKRKRDSLRGETPATQGRATVKAKQAATQA
jgi:hypothetical protein